MKFIFLFYVPIAKTVLVLKWVVIGCSRMKCEQPISHWQVLPFCHFIATVADMLTQARIVMPVYFGRVSAAAVSVGGSKLSF
jgi:hypothetical protein